MWKTSAQLAQNALTLSLTALRKPNPPFVKDNPALSNISGVPGISSNCRRQFHTEESCTVAKVSDCNGGRTLATAQNSKRNHAHTAKILLNRVECSSFELRSSVVTWSECLPKTRMPCSLIGNDWSPPPDHHWWTGSPPCLDNVLATNGERTCTVPDLRLPLVDSDPCVVPQGRLHQPVQNGQTLWGNNNEDVIQESKQFLTGQQTPGDCVEGFMLTQGEQGWQKRINENFFLSLRFFFPQNVLKTSLTL